MRTCFAVLLLVIMCVKTSKQCLSKKKESAPTSEVKSHYGRSLPDSGHRSLFKPPKKIHYGFQPIPASGNDLALFRSFDRDLVEIDSEIGRRPGPPYNLEPPNFVRNQYDEKNEKGSNIFKAPERFPIKGIEENFTGKRKNLSPKKKEKPYIVSSGGNKISSYVRFQKFPRFESFLT